MLRGKVTPVGGIKEKKSASSIFSKDVEHDVPKEIKTK